MRNERLTLATFLLLAVGAAQAEPGAWFPQSACDPQLPVVVALPGEDAVLRVHDRPDAPAHDASAHRGEDDRWRVALEEWSKWTPLPPPATETGPDGAVEVPLEEHRDFAFRVDGCTAELWVDADPGRLQEVRLGGRPARVPLAAPGWGGFLNTDAEYGGLAGRDTVSALLDFGAFAPIGVGRSAWFINRSGLRRLDSDWIRDDPDSALRLRLGDGITHSADWESAVRFGGVQWGTDFSLQPDRITFPLPSIAGSAAVASTAQLYLNGEQLSQQTVQPGQFRLESVPVLTGAGELSVVVRDPLGREQTVLQPFYASPRLLAAGINAFTVEGGFLRQAYTATNDRYTVPFTAAILQRGLSDQLTGLLRAAGAARRQQAGAELDWIADNWGVLTLSGAAAHTEAGWGGVATAAFEHIADPFSFTLRRRFATSAYGDLGRDPGSLRYSDAARLSWNGRGAGIGSFIYINEQPWAGSRVQVAGLAYSVQPYRKVQFYASWLRPLNGIGSDSIAVGVSISLGRGSTGGVQWNRDSGSSGPRAFLAHTPDGPLGWSYLGAYDARPQGVREAQVAVATERGSVGAGWAGFGSQGAPSASVQTGLALLDGQAYWTRPIRNSFAVVDASGVAGVHVYHENQPVGETDSRGRLLVPDLLPYQANRLSIDDRDLPVGLELSSASATIAAPAGAGVPVHFSVEGQEATRLRLTDGAGADVPAGAALWLDGTALPLPVGNDGLVYAHIGDGPHRLEARWDGQRCVAGLRIEGGEAAVAACAQDNP